ncbi:flagellar biosynthetic protein FliR [Acidovorax sp. GBBC 3334]|uniref:flagellar biosynthetic protein FliR n=1 Tax=Acidovorax sp. GBBC 3334 TaxID=2940496 RepID=UPI0023039D29|nr:flagellar biosynthetic protein FliR [Acidovorax sp. GBBC 3334]MDA8456946.1 flagellar biosynthetic protein FliR [Acidovorax sp. GBBC 3334]
MDSLQSPPFQALAGSAAPGLWAAFFLPSLRIAVVLAMTPVLYAMPAPNRVRLLVVMALSWVLAQVLVRGAPKTVPGTGELLQMALVELSLGATMALGILLAFAAFSLAGNLLDVQIGFGIAQVFDPVGNRASPLLVSAFNYIAVIGFMAADGHHALLRALAYSFEVFPPGAAWQIEGAAAPVFKQASGLFMLGFALAAPVVFCILLVEFALSLISRNLPQINMLVLGIPVKIVVGLAVLSLWFTGMGGTMNRIYGGIYGMWETMFIQAAAAPRPGDR